MAAQLIIFLTGIILGNLFILGKHLISYNFICIFVFDWVNLSSSDENMNRKSM